MTKNEWFVIKRADGRHEEVHFDKITARIEKLTNGLNTDYVQPVLIAKRVVDGLFKGITTVELDLSAMDICASLIHEHPDYSILAGRIAISNLHKQTKSSFSQVIIDLFNSTDNNNNRPPLISQTLFNIVQENSKILDSAIIDQNDFNFNYYSFKMLENMYLSKINGKIVERPQHFLMRVSIGIHENDIQSAIETYKLMSEKYFIPSSTILYNIGTRPAQLNSSFVLTMKNDSLEGVFDTLKRCALISKYAGNISLNVHCIRSSGTPIVGTNGTSTGLVPMLRVFNDTANVNNQTGKSRGSICIYVESWHADIFEFLDLKRSTGSSEQRARDLNYALWIPDLFMTRVNEDGDWTLMCPKESPGLDSVFGEAFNHLYEKYETLGLYKKRVKARLLWKSIVEMQIETGSPSIFYKDACNIKSNQQNLGAIKCADANGGVVQYSSSDQIAACNSATIALNMFVDRDSCEFDFEMLYRVTKVVTKSLNKLIDITKYPLNEAEMFNKQLRPIGIGVQGLADLFFLLHLPFESDRARLLNKRIFETLYFAALESSCELARSEGRSYEMFNGCPASRGILQFDMWNVRPSDLWDWDSLREKIKKYGVRNSLLVALTPNESTCKIFGNFDSIEPIYSNVYTNRVLSTEARVVNPYLVNDLLKLNLWNKDMKNEIINSEGSIQCIEEIPQQLKLLYKTIWEISQKSIIDMAADRAVFIDQSQSIDIYMDNVNFSKVTSMHFYAWNKGLKTGVVHLHTRHSNKLVENSTDKGVLNIKSTKIKTFNSGNAKLSNGYKKDIRSTQTTEFAN